jgi:hypothetical protein
MKIFNYCESTGRLLGTGSARPDPMQPGSHLLPAHATTQTPPAAPAGTHAAFNGSSWGIAADPPPDPALGLSAEEFAAGLLRHGITVPESLPEQISATDALVVEMGLSIAVIKSIFGG